MKQTDFLESLDHQAEPQPPEAAITTDELGAWIDAQLVEPLTCHSEHRGHYIVSLRAVTSDGEVVDAPQDRFTTLYRADRFLRHGLKLVDGDEAVLSRDGFELAAAQANPQGANQVTIHLPLDLYDRARRAGDMAAGEFNKIALTAAMLAGANGTAPGDTIDRYRVIDPDSGPGEPLTAKDAIHSLVELHNARHPELIAYVLEAPLTRAIMLRPRNRTRIAAEDPEAHCALKSSSYEALITCAIGNRSLGRMTPIPILVVTAPAAAFDGAHGN